MYVLEGNETVNRLHTRALWQWHDRWQNEFHCVGKTKRSTARFTFHQQIYSDLTTCAVFNNLLYWRLELFMELVYKALVSTHPMVGYVLHQEQSRCFYLTGMQGVAQCKNFFGCRLSFQSLSCWTGPSMQTAYKNFMILQPSKMCNILGFCYVSDNFNFDGC